MLVGRFEEPLMKDKYEDLSNHKLNCNWEIELLRKEESYLQDQYSDLYRLSSFRQDPSRQGKHDLKSRVMRTEMSQNDQVDTCINASGADMTHTENTSY